MAGNLDFERIFRAHVNTLMDADVLVPLWICALYFSGRAAPAVGLFGSSAGHLFLRL